MQLKELMLFRLVVILMFHHLLEAIFLDIVIMEVVMLFLKILVIHLGECIARHVFSTHEKRILSFFVGMIFEYLLVLASLCVESIRVSL